MKDFFFSVLIRKNDIIDKIPDKRPHDTLKDTHGKKVYALDRSAGDDEGRIGKGAIERRKCVLII